MGYDMYTVQPADEAEKAAILVATAHMHTLTSPHSLPAGPERDSAHQAWEQARREVDEATKSYFRLNIWGMSKCADLMNEVGMLTRQAAPEWPELDAYGLTEYPDDPTDYDGDERAKVDAELTDKGREFLAVQQAVTDHEPQPIEGIPAHKFFSNDGWLVTPSQCEAALAAWEKAPAELRTSIETGHEWWARWVAFLTHSKDRGGFRVH